MRPLLSLHKAQLVRLCSAAGLQWVEDPTNSDTSYARNKVRAVLQQQAAAAAAPVSTVATSDLQQRPGPAPGALQRSEAAPAAAQPGVTADILQLVAACNQASAELQRRAEAALRASLRRPTRGRGAVMHHRPLLEAGAPAAARALAHVMQVPDLDTTARRMHVLRTCLAASGGLAARGGLVLA